MQETMEFDLVRKEVKVNLRSPHSGTVEEYTLRELDGVDRDGYLNNLGSRLRIGPDGKSAGVKNFEGMQSNLVSRSLYDANGQRVSEATIQSWPASIQTALFKRAQQISGLEDGAETSAKND